VLQCVAVCCSVLQCVAVCCSELQWVAVGCSMLQCATERHPQRVCMLCVISCRTLSTNDVAVCCSVLHCVAVCCSMLQCIAVCCSVLQFVAVYCIVLQCAAACCSVLQYFAVCCGVLQCAVVCCSLYPRILGLTCRKRLAKLPHLLGFLYHIFTSCVHYILFVFPSLFPSSLHPHFPPPLFFFNIILPFGLWSPYIYFFCAPTFSPLLLRHPVWLLSVHPQTNLILPTVFFWHRLCLINWHSWIH